MESNNIKVCKNKEYLKKKLIRYYHILNYIIKLLYKKDIKNILFQSGGDNAIDGIVTFEILLIILFLPFYILSILFRILIIRPYYYIRGYDYNRDINGRRYYYGGGGDLDNYSQLIIKRNIILKEEICTFEMIDKMVCYKNYLKTPYFMKVMISSKNFLIVNMIIIKFLNNLFGVISKQGGELISLKETLNVNIFINILNYKIEYLNNTEIRSSIVYYKFSLTNKKTKNIYYFELTMNQIKKIFSLRDFSKIKYFMNDSFLNYVYDMIHTKKDFINNKSSILNKVFTSRINKRVSNKISNIADMYKLLKRIFSNLLIDIHNDFKILKRNSYYRMTTVIKKDPAVFISQIVDDLCGISTMNINFKDINKNIKNMDKRIEDNKTIENIDERIKKNKNISEIS